MDDEIEQLKREIERLQKALNDRQQVSVASPSLIDNQELITDLARYAEGLLPKEAVKKKWREIINENMWKKLAEDDELVRAIELEKVRRVRNGQAKREKSQQLITKAPDVLDEIMMDAKTNARHKVDAIKTLDALAGGSSPEAIEQNRIVIRIDLGADIRAAGGTPDPKDVLVIEASPSPLLTDKSDE